jgi:hypothetical protein
MSNSQHDLNQYRQHADETALNGARTRSLVHVLEHALNVLDGLDLDPSDARLLARSAARNLATAVENLNELTELLRVVALDDLDAAGQIELELAENETGSEDPVSRLLDYAVSHAGDFCSDGAGVDVMYDQIAALFVLRHRGFSYPRLDRYAALVKFNELAGGAS